MSTILVSILSKHTLPNYLFAKEIEGRYDELVFITTPEADKDNRDVQIERALQLKEREVVYISVDGNDYRKALGDLKSWTVRNGDKYIVNLTGGTKMMSLAVHDFFSAFNTTFCYVPIGKNTYYNLKTGEWKPIAYRASLKEYFALYGISYEALSEDYFGHSREEAYDIFDKVRNNKFRLPAFLWNAQQASTADLRKYYAGEWFEQFTYFKLKEVLNLRKEDIALSLRIFRKTSDPNNDNELDVAFMSDNMLHVVECKVSMYGGPGRSPRDVVEEYLYKLAAISKDFGLQVRSYLFTLHKMRSFSPQERQSFSKRCRILGLAGIVSDGMLANLKSSLRNQQALLP